MEESSIIYGMRPVLEAIQSEKTIDKVLLQKGLGGPLFKDLFIKIRENKIPFQYVPANIPAGAYVFLHGSIHVGMACA